MMTLRLSLPLVVLLAGPIAHAVAQEKEATPPVKAQPVKQEPVTFAVVQIGEQLKVVKSSELEATRTELKNTYAKELKRFEEAKKAAETAKTPFNQKAPIAQTLLVLKDQVKTMDDANAHMKQVLADRQAAKEKEAKAKEAGQKKEEAGAAAKPPIKGK